MDNDDYPRRVANSAAGQRFRQQTGRQLALSSVTMTNRLSRTSVGGPRFSGGAVTPARRANIVRVRIYYGGALMGELVARNGGRENRVMGEALEAWLEKHARP
jgi:hypothetical protein